MECDILAMTKNIATNLSDYERMLKIMGRKENQRTWEGIEFEAFSPLTLSHGLPGICLLYGKLMECCPKEDKWGRFAHNYLSLMVEELNKKGFQSLSMFSGAAGVALSVASVSNDFLNYNKLLNTLNDYILNRFEESYSNIVKEEGTHSLYYDVIEGLSGVLSYLGIYRNQRKYYNVITRGLEILVNLTKDIEIQGQVVPGWYIPVQNQFSELEQDLYPKGNFNTSLSHGIAGPLIILSDMMANGIIVDGQEEAIIKIIKFLFDFKLNDGERDFWKGQIDFDEVVNKKLTDENIIRRDAWCYGNPGICYAIVSAGNALDNQRLIDYGIIHYYNENNRVVAVYNGMTTDLYCKSENNARELLLDSWLIPKQCFSTELRQCNKLNTVSINYRKTVLPWNWTVTYVRCKADAAEMLRLFKDSLNKMGFQLDEVLANIWFVAGNRNSEELVAYILTNRYLLRLTSIDMGHVEVDQVVPDDCSALRLRDIILTILSL